MKKILILGCGIIGITTALTLQEKYRDCDVTIWSIDSHTNTTSNKAGAVWYLYLSEPKEKVSKWATFNLEYYQKNLTEDPSITGCVTQMTVEYFDHQQVYLNLISFQDII